MGTVQLPIQAVICWSEKVCLGFSVTFAHKKPETYKPKFHCRRQSGMNFGYVTVNGVNSNVESSADKNESAFTL